MLHIVGPEKRLQPPVSKAAVSVWVLIWPWLPCFSKCNGAHPGMWMSLLCVVLVSDEWTGRGIHREGWHDMQNLLSRQKSPWVYLVSYALYIFFILTECLRGRWTKIPMYYTGYGGHSVSWPEVHNQFTGLCQWSPVHHRGGQDQWLCGREHLCEIWEDWTMWRIPGGIVTS